MINIGKSGEIGSQTSFQKRNGFEGVSIPFLLVDLFQCPDDGRVEFRKFGPFGCQELVEWFFREEFRGVKVLGGFQALPGGFGLTPGVQLDPGGGALTELTHIEADDAGIDPYRFPLGYDGVDRAGAGKRFSEAAQGCLEIVCPGADIAPGPEDRYESVAVNPLVIGDEQRAEKHPRLLGFPDYGNR